MEKWKTNERIELKLRVMCTKFRTECTDNNIVHVKNSLSHIGYIIYIVYIITNIITNIDQSYVNRPMIRIDEKESLLYE